MDSKLYNAVINDELDALKEMESKLSVGEQRTPTASTVLHLACLYRSINCVREILKVHESLLLELDSRGETALHLAAREGHSDVVEELINKAKSSLIVIPNDPQNTSSTVIQFIIRLASLELETALHMAVRFKHNSVVQLLVKEDPKYIYPQNMYKETPLYLASIRSDAQIIQTILENCESPTFGGPDGRTALHAAVLDAKGSECVKLLLLNNKDLVKMADNNGRTVFHYVAFQDHYKLVEDLISADISVAYLQDKEYERTALHVAAERGNVRVLEQLLKHIPDSLEILDAGGQNLLHIAARKEQREVIELILSGADKASHRLLIQKDKDGNTPLHLIAEFGLYLSEIMDVKRVDWEVLNHRNLTPLDLVHSKRHGADYRYRHDDLRKKLIKGNVKQHRHLWLTLKAPDVEKGTTSTTDKEKRKKEEIEFLRRVINTNIIVSALIVTVAFTAGFTMPGGFDGNDGPEQGSAILLRKTAFQTFAVTDALALLCSMCSLFLYFSAQFYQNGYALQKLVDASTVLSLVSFVAIMLAFISGTYAVLAHSPALAVTVCVISSIFFLLVYYVIYTILDLMYNGESR